MVEMIPMQKAPKISVLPAAGVMAISEQPNLVHLPAALTAINQIKAITPENYKPIYE